MGVNDDCGCPRAVCQECPKMTCGECEESKEIAKIAGCSISTCQKKECPRKVCDDGEKLIDSGDEDSCGCPIEECKKIQDDDVDVDDGEPLKKRRLINELANI